MSSASQQPAEVCSKDNKAKCIPCSSLDKSHVLQMDDLKQRVSEQLKLWNIVEKTENTSGDSEQPSFHILSRSFVAKDFQSALDCINAMGVIAEEQGHHPNFHLTNYRDVEIEMYTHKLKGVTENDVLLAKMLDSNVQVLYSPKWLREHPEAEATAKK